MTIDELMRTAYDHKLTEAELRRLERRRHKVAEQLKRLDILLANMYTDCPGEAHSLEVGGMQDHCPICMPRWARVPNQDRVLTGVDRLSSARPRRTDI